MGRRRGLVFRDDVKPGVKSGDSESRVLFPVFLHSKEI